MGTGTPIPSSPIWHRHGEPHHTRQAQSQFGDRDFVSPAFRESRSSSCDLCRTGDGRRGACAEAITVRCAARDDELGIKGAVVALTLIPSTDCASLRCSHLFLQVLSQPAVHVKNRLVRTDLSITLISLGEPVNPQRSENYSLISFPLDKPFFACPQKSSKH